MPSGKMLEQWSCRNPGSVRAAVRAPPPIVGSASYTVTRNPDAAHTMAAASPFGPDPITMASRVLEVEPRAVGHLCEGTNRVAQREHGKPHVADIALAD